MPEYIQVTRPSDSNFKVGQIVTKEEFDRMCRAILEQGGEIPLGSWPKPSRFDPLEPLKRDAERIDKAIRPFLIPEDRLVKRTKRGSLIKIEREGNKAVVDVFDYMDMNDLTRLLNAAGVRFEMSQPPKMVGKGWRVEFDFAALERVMASLNRELLLIT